MAATGIILRRNIKNNLLISPPVVGEIVFATDTYEIGMILNGELVWLNLNNILTSDIIDDSITTSNNIWSASKISNETNKKILTTRIYNIGQGELYDTLPPNEPHNFKITIPYINGLPGNDLNYNTFDIKLSLRCFNVITNTHINFYQEWRVKGDPCSGIGAFPITDVYLSPADGTFYWDTSNLLLDNNGWDDVVEVTFEAYSGSNQYEQISGQVEIIQTGNYTSDYIDFDNVSFSYPVIIQG